MSVTSLLLIRAFSLLFISVSRLLFCLILSVFFNKLSNVPKLFMSSAAVLTPIPGTPGTLSLLSPANAWTSMTFVESTPNFFSTSTSEINL